MALTQIAVSSDSGSGSTATPPKTIAVRVYSGNTALMYTVPAGRKWVGRIGSHASNSSSYFVFITPSGQTVNNGTTSIQMFGTFFHQNSHGSYSNSDGLITLHAGDMVHTANNTTNGNWMLLGEESDV